MAKHILVSVSEGHVVRNLLENGILDGLSERGFNTTLVTPAFAIPSFTERWGGPGMEFAPLFPYRPGKGRARWAQLRRAFARRGNALLAARVLDRERRDVTGCPLPYRELVASKAWDVVLATHIHLPHESPILNAARRRGIPSIGLVNSWDNVHKGMSSHPDHALVWSDLNKAEMVEIEGYPAGQVSAIGAPAFDPYFDTAALSTRDVFCRALDLDPSRPVLLYATLGQFVPFFEETNLLRVLLDAIGQGRLPNRPQVVVRLHPWTRSELFEAYVDHPDVRISRYRNYVPTLDWTPTREEVVEAARLLAHSDLCLTPGSTMALEAAIFDTPVVVPVFNEYQPAVWEDYYKRYCLASHFGRLVEEKMLPLARTEEDLLSWIRRYLEDPEVGRPERKRIVSEYVQFTDGRALERLLHAVEAVADGDNLKWSGGSGAGT